MIKTSLTILTLLFTPAQLWAQSPSIIANAQKAQQSVVTVVASQRQFFADQDKMALFQRKGAGVIIDASGLIVTNLHTIISMNFIQIQFTNELTTPGRLVKIFPEYDLALIKIYPPFTLSPIEFSNNPTIQLGQEVIHVGHSSWLKNTLSAGKIVGLGKNRYTQNLDVFEVNLHLYKGDSGGPVLDDEGNLLGIMTARRNDQNKASFAIPAYKIENLYINYLKTNP